VATTLMTPIKCSHKGLRKYEGECKLYSPASRLGPMMGRCEHASETSGSIVGD